MLTGTRNTVERARKLRKAMSLPEVLLWRELRRRPGGIKFRRQHPAGSYVLDFYCSDATLAIEIDGEAHDRGGRAAHDVARDAWLAKQGVATLRLAARDVLRDLDAVVAHVVMAARARLPLHRPLDGPPPRSGEDF